jgi:hypothetical protein
MFNNVSLCNYNDSLNVTFNVNICNKNVPIASQTCMPPFSCAVSFHFGFSTGGPLTKAWLNGGAVCRVLNSKPNLLRSCLGQI